MTRQTKGLIKLFGVLVIAFALWQVFGYLQKFSPETATQTQILEISAN